MARLYSVHSSEVEVWRSCSAVSWQSLSEVTGAHAQTISIVLFCGFGFLRLSMCQGDGTINLFGVSVCVRARVCVVFSCVFVHVYIYVYGCVYVFVMCIVSVRVCALLPARRSGLESLSTHPARASEHHDIKMTSTCALE